MQAPISPKPIRALQNDHQRGRFSIPRDSPTENDPRQQTLQMIQPSQVQGKDVDEMANSATDIRCVTSVCAIDQTIDEQAHLAASPSVEVKFRHHALHVTSVWSGLLSKAMHHDFSSCRAVAATTRGEKVTAEEMQADGRANGLSSDLHWYHAWLDDNHAPCRFLLEQKAKRVEGFDATCLRWSDKA